MTEQERWSYVDEPDETPLDLAEAHPLRGRVVRPYWRRYVSTWGRERLVWRAEWT